MILVAVMLGVFACSASEIEVTRVVEIEVTREVPIEIRHEIVVTHEVEVPVEVVREVEVIRNVEVLVEVARVILVTRDVEVPVEVMREVEVTRVVEATPTSTPTPTPSPSPTLSPTNTPTPTVDVGDVDYVRDIEIPAEFVVEAANAAAAYCDNRTFAVSHDVNDHFHGFFNIESGTDDCRGDALAAMAVRSKRMSETRSRYIFQGNKMNECHYEKTYSNDKWRECGLVDLYPARHSPDYDREKLIVMFEDQPPEYPFDYLLTEDELWARNQIWRSVIRYYHYQCMRRAEVEAGRVLYFDRGSYIGHLPDTIVNWWQFDDIPPYYWGSDRPDIGLCSAYDIKTRSEYFMWGYDSVYFSALATGWVLSNADPGSNDFAGDLAAMRANPPEIPNRFAASSAVAVPTETPTAVPTDTPTPAAMPIPTPVKANGNGTSEGAQDVLSSDPYERGKAIADFWWRNVWEAYPEIIFTPEESRRLEPARDWAGQLTLQYFDGSQFEPYQVWVGKSSGRWYQREFLPRLVDQLNSHYFFTASEEFQHAKAQEFILNDVHVMFSIFKEYTEGDESYAWTPPMLGNMIWVHTAGWIEHDPDSPNCDDWVASIGTAFGENVVNICYQGSVFVLDEETGDLISVQGNAAYAVDHSRFIPDGGPGYPYKDDYVYN